MPAWETARHELMEYSYALPTQAAILSWLDREPTLIKCSVAMMKPGFVVWTQGKRDIWLCMGVVEVGARGRDILFVSWLGPNSAPKHIQQVFTTTDEHIWDCAMYPLDEKASGDYCPHCLVRLQWTTMWCKCPSCWWTP